MKKLLLLSLSLGLTAALCAPFASTSLRAQTTGASTTPRIISYQGVLDNADGTPVNDGNYAITVRLYADKDGTNEVWRDTYTVPVTGGVFNLALGGGQLPIPDAKAMDKELWLSTQIGEGPEMRPLSQLSASAYALNVPDNSITANKIAANYVGSLSVNGQPVSTKGGNVNFTASGGVSLNFDPVTNAIIVGGAGAG
ncbi:MAG: hypothetical protein Q8922_15755, partial [Bacteroidota bacterium]|nr:hypothetical protein [Bacteroidota bacterium]